MTDEVRPRRDAHDDWDTWDQETYFKGASCGVLIKGWSGEPLPCLNGGFLGLEFEEGVTA